MIFPGMNSFKVSRKISIRQNLMEEADEKGLLLHRRDGRENQGLRVAVLHVPIGHIVDLVPFQNLGDGVAVQLLKVGVVQIDARGGVGGAKVNGQGHPALQKGPWEVTA